MKLNILREKFLAYFKRNGHTVVPSSSTVPGNDPTLLFTNAGMVQFKEVFLGTEKRNYQRAVSSQCCIRAGGKHNDLENVGYTARHHTFFEMLGNFSFGDYFKREAIRYAWEFLTKELNLPPEKLWVTVFEEDDEAADIWLKEMGVSKERFSRCGAKDNFWAMGDTGPCGPCSEIYFDHGPSVPGGPPGSPEAEGDRYVEIWNLVFMQYERSSDGTLAPLPMKAVDTGMGLERISAVLQGVHSNYDTDLFQNLIRRAADLLHVKDIQAQSLKVIADHIRACSFLIQDGVMPSNEGRGYVLRRIMRRALRHGYKLGAQDFFFHKMVAPLVKEMAEAYPNLKENQALIEKIILKEEEQFARTLESGMKLLDEAIADLKGKTISGEIVFKLYDTYGFPVDLTADIARERDLHIDEAGFERLMTEQRQRAREASQFGVDYTKALKLEVKSEFTGHEKLEDQSNIVVVLKDNQPCDTLKQGEKGAIVLATTPFYGESGGQVGDQGVLVTGGARFQVEDTHKASEAIVHYGHVISGVLKQGETVHAYVDEKRRREIVLNHSATHLLHAALRKVLGTHVIQKGSLVAPDRLRFDFSHFSALTAEEILKIEDLVNEKIREDLSAKIEITDSETAQKKGAMALFGEKYGDKVRMLAMGDFSLELCGGTHVERTGEVGSMKIISETGIASGIRRIEAITGQAAIDYARADEAILKNIAALLKTEKGKAMSKVADLANHAKQLEKENQMLKQKLAQSSQVDWKSNAKEISGIKVLVTEIPGADIKLLRTMVDDYKAHFKTAVIVLASVEDQKVSLLAGVTSDVTNKVAAGELVNFVAQQVGGKGGGRPELAQAGGTQPDNLQGALKSVDKWLSDRLETKEQRRM
ncbi:MAG: alanine--tRNA ligase [Gammaproteobacteria bacterium]